MLSNSNKSEIAVLKVELEANKKGYSVSLPRNGSSRYDLIVDSGTKLYRCQIKYLNRLANKGRSLELVLSSPTNKIKPYSKEDVDLLLIYLPSKDCILCIKPERFHNRNTFIFNMINKSAPTYF